MRDDMKGCRFWTAIPGSDTEKEFLLIFSVFGGFDDNIPVTIIPRNTMLRKKISLLRSARFRGTHT
jgi:hypothetical protein